MLSLTIKEEYHIPVRVPVASTQATIYSSSHERLELHVQSRYKYHDIHVLLESVSNIISMIKLTYEMADPMDFTIAIE